MLLVCGRQLSKGLNFSLINSLDKPCLVNNTFKQLDFSSIIYTWEKTTDWKRLVRLSPPHPLPPVYPLYTQIVTHSDVKLAHIIFNGLANF